MPNTLLHLSSERSKVRATPTANRSNASNLWHPQDKAKSQSKQEERRNLQCNPKRSHSVMCLSRNMGS